MSSAQRRLKAKDLRSRQSLTSMVRFHLSESEDASLERIHTFNLRAEEAHEKPKKRGKKPTSLRQLLSQKVLSKGVRLEGSVQMQTLSTVE